MKTTPEILAARAKWRYRGGRRPSFAAAPASAGVESVWDYPRPPRIEADGRRVVVRHEGRLLADTRAALRVLETASPPCFYLPAADVDVSRLRASPRRSVCEWKGLAREFELAHSTRRQGVAWAYEDLFEEYAALADRFAFYPAAVPCEVDGERVRPQPGGYYGGWATSEVLGPFKGEPGTESW